MFPSWDSLNELETFQALLKSTAFWGAIIFGIAAVVIGAWWAWYNNKLDDRIDELRKIRDAAKEKALRDDVDAAKKLIPPTTGLLTTGPSATTSPAKPSPATTFLLGDSSFQTSSFPVTLVQQGDEDLITLDRDSAGWVISGKFFNERGKIICELVKNVFYMNPGNYFRIDNTPSHLVVYNNESRPILDIELVNESEFRLTGDFFIRGGQRIAINKQAISVGNARFHFNVTVMPPGGHMTVLSFPGEPKGFAFENTPKDGRAWVVFQSPIEVALNAAPVINTKIGLLNAGEYPAMLTRTSVGVVFVDNEQKASAIVQQLDNAPSTNVTPPPLESGQYGGVNGVVHESVSKELLTSVNDKSITAIFVGKIWYTDKTGVKGESWFCGKYNPATRQLEPIHGCSGMK